MSNKKETQPMKLKIDRAALVRELNYVCRVVPANPTLPVLGCVLLEVEGDTLRLRTSNMDLTLTASVDAQVTDSGAVCAPAKRLAKIFGEMSDAVVGISVSDKNEIEIVGAACKFRILGLPWDEFPCFPKPTGTEIEIPGSVLGDAVSPALHAVSDDETRLILNSVLVELNGGEIRAVATDGRRLAVCGGKVAPGGVVGIVPTDTARLLVALADAETVTLLIGPDNITAKAGNRELASKLIAGAYPNYKQVIPTDTQVAVEVDAVALKTALHRVALVSDSCVQLEFAKASLTIKGASAEIGSGAEVLPLEKELSTPIAMSFNPQYLIDALSACGDTAVLKMADECSPMVVSADRFLSVVMPLRKS